MSPWEAKLFPVNSSGQSNPAELAHTRCNRGSALVLTSGTHDFFLYLVPELTLPGLGSGCEGRGQKEQVK